MAAYNPKDFYFHQAKKQGFVARSAFKLEEMDRRFRIFRGGDTVVDLGCAPGSWAQYTSKRVGTQGRILGIDLQRVTLSLPNALFVEGDFRTISIPDFVAELGTRPDGSARPIDVVLSDMAPKTSGVRDADQARSLELCELALHFARDHLKQDGNFVTKLFHSGEFESFRKQMRGMFAKVEALRPESTRKESKEIFLIGLKRL